MPRVLLLFFNLIMTSLTLSQGMNKTTHALAIILLSMVQANVFGEIYSNTL